MSLYAPAIQTAVEASIYAVGGPLPRTTAAFGLISSMPVSGGPWTIADLDTPVETGLDDILLANVPASPSVEPDGSLQRAWTTIVGWTNDGASPVTIAGVFLCATTASTSALVIVPLSTAISLVPGQSLYVSVTFRVSPAGIVTATVTVS